MTKKFKEETWQIRILNPEGKKKIDELIKLGLIKTDDVIINALLQLQELKENLDKDKEELNHYINKARAESKEIKKEMKRCWIEFEKAIASDELELINESKWFNNSNKDVN